MKTTIGIDISKKTLEISNLDKFSSCENNKKDIEIGYARSLLKNL